MDFKFILKKSALLKQEFLKGFVCLETNYFMASSEAFMKVEINL